MDSKTSMDSKYSYTFTTDPAGSRAMDREPSGIIESYENVMKIFKRSSPMSNWRGLTMALHELGSSIYGDGR